MFKDIQNFIIAQILFFLRVHGIGDIDAADINENSSPIVHEGRPGYDYDTFTLDRIEADFAHKTFAVEASSSDDNGTWQAEDLPIEVVCDIFEWLMQNEDHVIEYAKEARGEDETEGKKMYVVDCDDLVEFLAKKYGKDEPFDDLNAVSDEDFKAASEELGWSLSIERFVSEFNADGNKAPMPDTHFIRLI